MDLLQQIVARAKADKQRIVLPEAEEERTLKAADKVLADDLADIILIGNPDNIKKLAAEWGLANIGKATIVDPLNNPKSEEYATLLAELRKKKGMTIEQARDLVTKNNLYLGCMIIKTEGADGQISGALSTTGDTLRPALQIIKCAPGITCVSGAMLLISDQKQFGEDGVVVMGDVAVTPNPTAEQLSQIAFTTAQTAKDVAGFAEPRVAMLSFSTKGSAKDAIDKATGKSVYIIDKVTEATKLAHENYPDLHVDGELQADAALVPSVGAKKAPGSPIAGKANVLIVPNLEVGNIGYKLVQRLGNVTAIGPVLQGIARPVNDLSRGCSIDDIYYMVAITACQAQDAKQQ
jgi:phosphate acetyltransferase